MRLDESGRDEESSTTFLTIALSHDDGAQQYAWRPGDVCGAGDGSPSYRSVVGFGRQKVDVVLGGQLHHLFHVFQLVELVEELLQLACG